MKARNLKSELKLRQKIITSGKGVPGKKEGVNGDLVVRAIKGKGLFLFYKFNNNWYSARLSNVSPKNAENKEDIIVPLGNRAPSKKGELRMTTSGKAYIGEGQGHKKQIVGAKSSGVLDVSEITLTRAKDSGSASTEDFLIKNTGSGRAYLHIQTNNANADPYLLLSYLQTGETNELKQWAVGMDNSSSDVLRLCYKNSGTAPLTPSTGTPSEIKMTLDTSGNLDVEGTLTIGSIAADSAGDNYLVEVSGVVKKRTPAEVRSDIGAGTSSVGALDDLSDVTYSSGDLTISSLDKIIVSNDLLIQTGDGAQDLFKLIIDGATHSFFSVGGESGSYSSLRLNEAGGDSTTDHFKINTAEHGETTISTVDTAGADADLTMTIDGSIAINSATSTDLSSGSTDITLTSARDLVVDSGRYINLDSNNGVWNFKKAGTGMASIADSSLNLKESADAVADSAGYGQIWVHNDTPNNLYFTDDAGNDIQITNNGKLRQRHFMDWYYFQTNLATQNYFYAEKHNDEYAVSSNINTDLSSSGYSTTTLNNAWRMIRYARRIPYAGNVTKFMVHLEATGAAADSDVEVALWWADALADDTEHSSGANFTCAHLCTLTFDFSLTSRFMTKQTTSFNATAISEGDWFFITMRKITSGDGSSFHCHSTVLWEE